MRPLRLICAFLIATGTVVGLVEINHLDAETVAPRHLAQMLSRGSEHAGWHWTRKSDNGHIEVKARGDIRFTALGTGVERLEPGAWLHIDDRRDGRRLQLKITAGPKGAPAYEFTDARRDRAMRSDDRRWLGEVLQQMVREAGIGLEERIEQRYSDGGVSAALTELSFLRATEPKRIGYRVLLHRLPVNDPTLTTQVLPQMMAQVQTDDARAYLLREALGGVRRDAGYAALLDAASRISDGTARRDVLQAVLEQLSRPVAGSATTLETAPMTLKRVVHLSEQIDSDADRAEVLARVALACPPQAGEVQADVLRAARRLRQPDARRRVAVAFLERGAQNQAALAPETWTHLRSFIAEISDPDIRTELTRRLNLIGPTGNG